eukprot:gene7701-9162_t
MAADDKHSALERPSEWLYELIKHSDWRKFLMHFPIIKRFSSKFGLVKGAGTVLTTAEGKKKAVLRVEAMRIIMEERGYTLKEDPWSDAAVKVLDTEKKGKGVAHKAQVLFVNEEGGTVLTVAPGVGLREFAFDTVYGTSTKQSTVYRAAPRHLVMDFINGMNASIIVYGQTGSGKTYTMFGPDASEVPSEYHLSREEGIVPRVCTEVLTASKAREALGIKAEVSLSFIEVYGDGVKDLLRDQVVGQSRVAGQRYVLDGQAGQPVNNMQEVKALLATGDALKRQAATAMNDRSSRAHSVVVLTLKQRDVATGVQRSSQLFLVDLGGSEKISKSKADEGVKGAGTVGWEEYYEGRERLQEATYINQGLFALKKCIDGLNDREQAALDGRPDPYIPYQDSKLTMLLSSALGGNSKTLVVVTASVEARHALETVQALRFGERCGNVANRAQMTGATLQRTLDRIDKEVEECEELIKRFERWETVRVVRKDEFDGEEVVVKSMLVGAEEHRERMEALLARRRELLGQPEPEAMAEQNLKALSIPDSALPLAVPAC